MKLPINLPPIVSYQQISLPMTVAMVNPTYRNWLYSNYIQVMCVNRDHHIISGNNDNFLHYTFYNPELAAHDPIDYVCVSAKAPISMMEDLHFIESVIDDGWYIYTDADIYYIDDSEYFGAYHYNHDMLIYGYDDMFLYIYMYGKSVLQPHQVPFSHFFDAYYSEHCDRDTYRNRVFLIKPNNTQCAINTEKIKWHMSDYLNGVETFAREFPNVYNPHSLTSHGIATYNEFEKMFDYAIINKEYCLRYTDFFCLYEHKKLMLNRIEYLNEVKILHTDSDTRKMLRLISNTAEMLVMLSIKCSQMSSESRQLSTIQRMKEYIVQIREEEIFAWNKCIECDKEILL